ncbi:MAG: hypothetical protein HY868_17620 [Chloroflexi bacterium]|nr:hypothetical protein [Chloroflexota bacterium]
MPKRTQVIGVWLSVIVILLACSPQAIVQEMVGARATDTPTPRATSIARIVTSAPTVMPTPTSIPTLVSTLAPSATPALAVTSTPTPAPLPLRTDLPALALRDWQRPANDNGRCFHFLPRGYYTARDFEVQVPRLKGLQARWVLALYSDENQLRLAATQFKAAGVMPIWRKAMRAYQRYYSWERDMQILKEVGLPPYFQIYNEPDVEAEWDGREVNRDQWSEYFIQAAKDVYNAGGYVGMQVLDEAWLSLVIQKIKARQGERLFGRMFFIPHPYGLNHPPNFTEDDTGVLGYRVFADVFQKELGFVPPFIAGEGGWKFKASDDNRFPVVDDKLHAQYHVELFNWFLTGKVSDGAPLPDYLFAFCPWILAGEMEGAAWYDSFEGNRELTIAEVKKLTPAATRKFSWDKK